MAKSAFSGYLFVSALFALSPLLPIENEARAWRLPTEVGQDLSQGLMQSWLRLDVAPSVDDYRLGDEWGKKLVALPGETAGYIRAARATAHYGGATTFFLGKFNGRYVMATNHHVAEAYACTRTAVFPILGISLPCTKLYGSWPEIDLALFEVAPTAQQAAQLEPVGANFDYATDITPGQPLLTIGFGIGGNPAQQMMANQDSDCKVFSRHNEFRFMGDPDQLNPGTYKAWSFANGCDVSHGDSGSAMVDRRTGAVVGIIWTGAIPKAAEFQSSVNLKRMLENDSPEIWTGLSYAVPAVKIREFLAALVQKGEEDEQVLRTIAEIVR